MLLWNKCNWSLFFQGKYSEKLKDNYFRSKDIYKIYVLYHEFFEFKSSFGQKIFIKFMYCTMNSSNSNHPFHLSASLIISILVWEMFLSIEFFVNCQIWQICQICKICTIWIDTKHLVSTKHLPTGKRLLSTKCLVTSKSLLSAKSWPSSKSFIDENLSNMTEISSSNNLVNEN